MSFSAHATRPHAPTMSIWLQVNAKTLILFFWNKISARVKPEYSRNSIVLHSQQCPSVQTDSLPPHSMKIAILLTCTMDHGDPRYCSYLLTGIGYPAMAAFRPHDHVAIRVCICAKIALEVCSCSQFRANGLTYFRMYCLYSFITGSVRFRLRPVITHLRTLYSIVLW